MTWTDLPGERPFVLLVTRAEDLPADEEYALFLRYTGLPAERLLRVRLEREAMPAFDLDEVADATRVVGDALDASPAMGEQPYTLEVSSPGVGRPLTEPRHFRRNVGRLVTAHHDGTAVTGRIAAASAREVTLELPATRTTPARTETLSYAVVERAVVEVEFARPDESTES